MRICSIPSIALALTIMTQAASADEKRARELVRTADGWKFALRIFQHLGTHSFPLLGQQPEGQADWAEAGASSR